jgi:PAS domain S-box-containing protein
MPAAEQLNIELISNINAFIRDPFFITDSMGNILTCNAEAEKILHIPVKKGNIFDLLDETTAGIVSGLIKEACEGDDKTRESNINITLQNGVSYNAAIHLALYKSGEADIVLFSILHAAQNLSFNDVTVLSFKINEIEKIVDNESILSVFNKLNSSFPFTFIGKEKFRAEINKLDEFFWLKDAESRYILVNDVIAGTLGINASLVEGKTESSFIPSFLHGLYTAAEDYMRETHNCIILDGIPVPGKSLPEKNRLIQVPLCDSDGNVVAFAGFTKTKKAEIQSSGVFKYAEQFLNTFPLAVCLIDKDGFIRNTSVEFCKLITCEFNDFNNRNYSEVLPSEISEKIKYFINSPIDFEKYDTIPYLYKDKYPDGFHISLSRLIEENDEPAGISLLIEKNEEINDLEKLLNVRGRMFDLIIKNNPEPIYIYDTENLRFLEVNDAALALYGYRKDEFLQMDLTDLYTPEDIQTLLDTSNVKTGDRQFSGPFRHKKKDGSSVFVEISKISFKYNDCDAHYNIVRDISDKLELEKDNQLYRAAFNNTEDLIFITDAEGFITFVNKPVTDVLGYSANDVDKTAFASLVKNEERATINTSVFQSHFKEVVSLTMELKKKDGGIIEFDLTATPVLDYKSDIESFIIVGKYQKGEVREIVNEVVKEVIVEKPVYNNSAVPAAAVPAESSQFISSLFHDILTPINVILGFVQELTESIKDITPEQKESVEIISQNRIQLLNIMNSIAEYTSIQKNNAEIHTENVSITEIIDELQNDFTEISNTRGIDFAYGRISSSLKFVSDKQRFRQFAAMVLNIAAGVTREKKIYFSSYQINDSTFALSVKDNYSGASKNFIDALTLLFNEPESNIKKDYGISKLTLRLAKSLLTMLNGKLEIFDGTTDKSDYAFVFPMKITSSAQPVEKETPSVYIEKEAEPLTIKKIPEPADNTFIPDILKNSVPVAEPEPVEELLPEPEPEFIPETEDEPEPDETEEEILPVPEIKAPSKSGKDNIHDRLDLSKLSCLYIEDQVDSQILFKVQMKELKSIKFAVSFEEALPLLDEGNFDFIVMDINLQGEYNGLDALKIIHKMPEYENIPIVAVTAYVLPGDKEKFIATGFNDFISKPIFRDKMIDSLEKIFMMDM